MASPIDYLRKTSATSGFMLYDLVGGSVLALSAGLLRACANMKFRYAFKGTVTHLNADSPSLSRKSVSNKLPFEWERVHFTQSVRKTNSCPERCKSYR